MGRTGSVEVIAGGMFSGKTEEMIRRLRRALFAKQRVITFKPSVDTRYSGDVLCSHGGTSLGAIQVESARDILDLVDEADVVGIDEAQFFEGISEVVQQLANNGKRVIVTGLDMDYRGIPFGQIPELMAIAEKVLKLNAVCVVCGGTACRSQRIVDSGDLVVIGAESAYEARCRKCWSPEPVFTRRENLSDMEG